MTKAEPLSTDNSPNAIDPDLADKLAELDRTDPTSIQIIAGAATRFEPVSDDDRVDVVMLANDGSTQTFEDVGFTPTGVSLDAELYGLKIEEDPAHRIDVPWPPVEQPTEETHATNPYLLESSTVLGNFHSEAQRAQLLINQIDHEIEHLTQDADFQIQRILIRRDAEVTTREKRKADLMKIVAAASMIGGKEQSDD